MQDIDVPISVKQKKGRYNMNTFKNGPKMLKQKKLYMENKDLKAARGIIYGIIIGSILWSVILIVLYFAKN